MPNLIMTSNRVDFEELAKKTTPPATESHKPIAHSLLVNLTREAIANAGLEITEEEHGLARGDLRYFGGFALTGENIQGDSRKLVLGLRNSHDKGFAAAVCIGNQMIVCENLCFGSDIKLARRHTLNIMSDLPRVLSLAVARITSHWQDMENRIAAYQEAEIRESMATSLLVSLVDKKAIPQSKIYPMLQEWRAPRHPEFKGQTVWNLYNAITEHLKGSDHSKLPARTMTVQSIFDPIAAHESVIDID